MLWCVHCLRCELMQTYLIGLPETFTAMAAAVQADRDEISLCGRAPSFSVVARAHSLVSSTLPLAADRCSIEQERDQLQVAAASGSAVMSPRPSFSLDCRWLRICILISLVMEHLCDDQRSVRGVFAHTCCYKKVQLCLLRAVRMHYQRLPGSWVRVVACASGNRSIDARSYFCQDKLQY